MCYCGLCRPHCSISLFSTSPLMSENSFNFSITFIIIGIYKGNVFTRLLYGYFLVCVLWDFVTMPSLSMKASQSFIRRYQSVFKGFSDGKEQNAVFIYLPTFAMER